LELMFRSLGKEDLVPPKDIGHLHGSGLEGSPEKGIVILDGNAADMHWTCCETGTVLGRGSLCGYP